MADRFPLVINTSTNRITEIPSGDNLDLDGARIVNCPGIGITDLNVTGVATIATINISNTTLTNLAITGITTIGNESTDTLKLIAQVNSDIIPDVHQTFNVGSATSEWRQGFFTHAFVSAGATIGTPGAGLTALVVNGDTRVTGILTVGGSSITINGDTNEILIGTVKLTGDGNVNSPSGIGTFNIIDAVTVDAGSNLRAVAGVVTTLTSTNATITDANITADARVGAALTVTGNARIGGDTTFVGTIDVDGQAIFDDITVSAASTFSGTITANGVATFNSNVSVNGDLTLGDASSDNITINSRFNSSLIPTTNDARDLGSDALQWRDLHINGTANIDTLNADSVNIDAGTIDGTAIGGNSASSGAFTTLSATGNVDLGSANTNTITATGQFDSDLVPATDNSFDLGSASKEWKDLFIDGTANIDSLVADTADINGGTIDGATIGGSSASSATFTTVTATTSLTTPIVDAVTVDAASNLFAVTGIVTTLSGTQASYTTVDANTVDAGSDLFAVAGVVT